MSRAIPASVEEYARRVADVLCETPVVSSALTECLGLCLAAPVHARHPMPPFDNSAMDGFAVRASDIASAAPESPVELPIAADIPAGRSDAVGLLPGTACRIMTGAPLPVGADAVVPVELVDDDRDRVRFSRPVGVRRHIRRVGEDRRMGELVLDAGTILGPAQLAAAAGCGHAALPVHRRVRVAVLATGSELAQPGGPLGYGQVFDTNGVMLASAVRDAGAEVFQLPSLSDDPDGFLALVERVCSRVDLLLTAGGISAGEREVVREALAGQGVDFGHIAMRPGGPQGLGRVGDLPVIALPGNPVAAWVSFQVLVRPALGAAMRTPERRTRSFARNAERVAGRAGVRTYRLAQYDPESATVTPVGGAGSHLVGALGLANCLIELAEHVTEASVGSVVPIVPTSSGIATALATRSQLTTRNEERIR